MKADLHVHSTASDGTLSPSELVTRAHANGVGVLALADHDSIEGITEARHAAEGLGIRLVDAVELSAVCGPDDIHVLAYFVDTRSEALARQLEALRAAREERAAAMVTMLNEAGFRVSIDDVRAIARGGSLGRSHVARALVEAGHAENVRDAFVRLIGRGRPYYVPKHSESPEAVIASVRALGALPVLAHPGVTGVDHLIARMVAAGLGGLEAYHGDHTPEQIARYAALARELGLLVTGGSDFHGPHAPNPDIGSVDLPPQALEAFLEAGERLRSG